METTAATPPPDADYHDVLRQALGALSTTSAAVPADAWRSPSPCAAWTALQVLQHAVGDQLAYVSAVTGGPGPDFDPFEPSGELEQAPDAFVEPVLAASAAAFAAVPADAAAVPNPLPQGPMPAWLVLGAAALDAGVHAWDIARAAGQPSPLTPALAGALLPVAHEIVEPLRAYGAYAAALPADPADAADPQTGNAESAALLRYLGRDPGWAG